MVNTLGITLPRHDPSLCPACNGSGISDSAVAGVWMPDCPVCGGTGHSGPPRDERGRFVRLEGLA